MRTSIAVALTLALAACGQGGALTGGSNGGWQVQEVRDELTDTATQTATRISTFDNGHVELTATCRGEQILLHYDEWGEAGPAGMGRAVEFRMTIIAANSDESFSLANSGTQMGLQSTVPLRASVQEGQEERLVGFVDHINSVTTQVPAAAFFGGDAITALRVEIPLLLQSAGSGQPPVAQNVVVDFMPQDENLRTLLSACDPSIPQATASVASATPPSAVQAPAFTLSSVPDGAMDSGAGCTALDTSGVNIFMTDFSTGAIYLNGNTVQLAIHGKGDVSDGGEFNDVSGRISVRIALTSDMTEVEHELLSAPANLTLVLDGAETVVPVSYQCGS